MRQCARGWCTGMAQRDGTGREVGGGIQDGCFIKIVILKIFKMPSNAALSLLYKEFICLKVNTSETMKTSLSDNWESHSVKAIAASDFPKSTKPPTGLIFTLHWFFFS